MIGFGKAIVSLGMDVKEDVDHLYDDDFIFCPIKGGLKVTVIGNGAKIYVKNPSDNDMNHLFYVSSGSTLFLDNVIVLLIVVVVVVLFTLVVVVVLF